MTIITAAISPDGVAAMACDSIGVGNGITTDFGPKVLRVGPHILAGFCDCYLVRNFIRRGLTEAIDEAGFCDREPAEAWDDFIDAVEDAWGEYLDRAGARLKDAEDAGTLLLATRWHIVECQVDGSILEHGDRPYAAIGGGSQLAIGAMWAKRRMQSALRLAALGAEAACANSPFCGGTIHGYEVGGEDG